MVDLLMILGICFLFIGLPTSIIITIVFAVKKKKIKTPAICIPMSFIASIFCLGIGGNMYGKTDEYKKFSDQQRVEREKEEVEEAEQETEEQEKRKQEELAEKEEKNEKEKREQDLAKTESKEKKDKKKQKGEAKVELFSAELIENWDMYEGKNIVTSFIVSSCNKEEKAIESDSFSEYDIYENLTIQLNEYKEFDGEEYLTVVGKVQKSEGYEFIISEADLVCSGSDSKLRYEKEKSEYEEKKRREAEEIEKQFRAEAVSVTYEELERYPDKYEEIKIKVSVNILEVEPDGIIFSGDIKGSLSGKDVAVYDERDIKEPKLLEGDSVTIYGYGNGLTTIKVQDTSGWIPKTVDKYTIPAIKIKYLDIN